MLTAKEQANILKIAEDMAKARVIAYTTCDRRGDDLDAYLDEKKAKKMQPAYLKIRENLVEALKEAG